MVDTGVVENAQRAASGVPVILAIALDEATRRRLATLLDGEGVLMFTHDVATARALLDGTGGQAKQSATDDEPPDEPVIRVGDLEIDQARCRVLWQGTPLALNKRDRDLLACLASDRTKVWTYRQLHAGAWDGGYLDPGRVHAAVKRLRRRLRETRVPMRIDAVRGVGYELVETDERG